MRKVKPQPDETKTKVKKQNRRQEQELKQKEEKNEDDKGNEYRKRNLYSFRTKPFWNLLLALSIIVLILLQLTIEFQNLSSSRYYHHFSYTAADPFKNKTTTTTVSTNAVLHERPSLLNNDTKTTLIPQRSLSQTEDVTNSSDNTTSTSNKTIVILMGNIRCGEKAWETLYKNVLDLNHADLALIVGDTLPKYDNATIWDRAKYVWRFDEYDDWADALDLINGPEWRTTVLPQLSSKALRGGILGGVNGTKGSGAIQGMIKWWLKQHIEEDGLLDQYDYFAVTRTDQYYSCPFPFNKLRGLDDTIFIPRGEEYSGYCDRFYITGKNQIIESLDIFPQFLNHYDDKIYNKLHNAERLLKTSWQRKQFRVKHFQRMMFTCATSDDQFRWRRVREENMVQKLGVIAKYPEEYNISQTFCSHGKNFMGSSIKIG